MNDTTENKPKKHICAALLAHVDAGKTTLSEAMLYRSGAIRAAGRVDDGSAFLDTDELERARGITIFSKQARTRWKELQLTLLDTPGHVDFSAEMERTLQVADAAVLVISGADGVQAHTQALWNLLGRYEIPTFVFVNKMDQQGTDRAALLQELQRRLSGDCVDFSSDGGEPERNESIAMCDENALDHFLRTGGVEPETIRRLVRERKLFPCFFGSALKLWGVDALLDALEEYACTQDWPEPFGARVYKIARDEQGGRLTFLKVTGGSLKVRMALRGRQDWEEKVNQIRLYNGSRYETVEEAGAGQICAVTGLTKTRPGEGLGAETDSAMPVLQPVLTYRIELPDGCDAGAFLPKLRELEEEEPQLHIVWREELKELQALLMGEVQVEVLQSLISRRFGVEVEFADGGIVYRETIAGPVEGIGHYEPLRHYAEVHLLMEPGEPGSGLSFASACGQDELDGSLQRLILTHLEEKEHRGVLTGSPITDMKLTLVAGRAHQKHTEGGDFRQATYRAVRQGLMTGKSILLEPWYNFRLEAPERLVGRAMADIEKMGGAFDAPRLEEGTAELTGRAPAAVMRGYQKELLSYTGGGGRLYTTLRGYEPCHNPEEVIEQIGYDPLRDTEDPCSSVFCAHGAGFVVEWDQVRDYMHMEPYLKDAVTDGELSGDDGGRVPAYRMLRSAREPWIGAEEADAILAHTLNANKRDKSMPRKDGWAREKRTVQAVSGAPDSVSTGNHTKRKKSGEEYLLVDGYNVIYAWEELKELAKINVDSARGRLLDILCNYQALKGCSLIVVFDAYRVKGHDTEILDYHNIHVVYTGEAETADQYIEKFAHRNAERYQVTVATSDGLEQIIVRGEGCLLMSSRELKTEVEQAGRKSCEEYADRNRPMKNYLPDALARQGRIEIARYADRDEPDEAHP